MFFATVLRGMNKKEWKNMHVLVYNRYNEYASR